MVLPLLKFDPLMKAALQDAFAHFEPQLPEGALDVMATHWAMVRAYNANINLTGISDVHEAAWLHYRDALAAWPLMGPGPTLDVGSGAGFPGIPLAIALPEQRFTLMEPRRKRASLLQTMVARLRLNRVSILCCRLEDAPNGAYEQVLTRATFSDSLDLHHAQRWLRPQGKLIAFRSAQSPLAQSDLQQLAKAQLTDHKAHPYTVGGHDRRLDAWISSADVGHK